MNVDEMDLRRMAMVPMLVSITGWTPSTPPGVLMTTAVDTNMAYCDYFKLMFAAWYGSHKVKLYISASIFHAVRMVFFLAVNSTADWRVCMHRVVEIQGNTEVELLIPYTAAEVATISPNTVAPYSLYGQVLTWSQADDSISNTIYINTYKAAASDMRFGAPLDVRYTMQSAPRDDFGADFEPIHPSVTGFSQTNLLFGEEILTLRTLMHRIYPRNTMAVPVCVPLIDPDRTPTNVLIGTEFYLSFFRFWRGSVRVKFFIEESCNSMVSSCHLHWIQFIHPHPARCYFHGAQHELF